MIGASRLARMAIAPALALSALAFVGYRTIDAADHVDPPARTDPNVDPNPDAAADIADIYAFHDAANLVVILTFAGPQATNLPAVYDRDLLYRLNISNAGARTDAEFPIEIRFGANANNNQGVRITNLPGGVTIEGPVENNLQSSNGTIARAGLFDDPFFFDSQGLRESRQMGTLRFNNQRNFFGGQNITAVVLQIPRPLIENGSNLIDIWSTADRFGGQN